MEPINPFQPSSLLDHEPGVFADHAQRLDHGFLYRVIDLRSPLTLHFVYDAWWFWQRVYVNEVRIWSRISWLRIERSVDVVLPAEIDPEQRRFQVDVQFGPGLRFRRFQIVIGGIVEYDEIC